MPAPGAASLLPQAETAMVIIEASARTASDVRIDARQACPPGAPERTMEGKARGRRVGAIGTFIGGRVPGWVWLSVAVPGREIGRAHVCTPVTNEHLVCRLLLYNNKSVARIKF